MVELEFTPNLSVREHDLGIEVGANRVKIPLSFRKPLSGMGVRSVEDFAAALVSFPSAFQSVTSLTAAQVDLASKRVIRKLQMSFPQVRIDGSPAKPQFRFGAAHPDVLDLQKKHWTE